MVITQVDVEDVKFLLSEERNHCGGWSVSKYAGLFSSTLQVWQAEGLTFRCKQYTWHNTDIFSRHRIRE